MIILAALVLSFNAFAHCSINSTHLILWSAALACPVTPNHGCLVNSLNKFALVVGFIPIAEISLLTSATLVAYSAGVKCPATTCVISVPHPYGNATFLPAVSHASKNVFAGSYIPFDVLDSCPPRTKFSFTDVLSDSVVVDSFVLAKLVAKYDNPNATPHALTAPSNAFSV